ncbi:hypothetical protein [Marinifilum sp. D714]|uniref:hypothetical protein n=1 Tax=Marinifilum sp. D714 TaxID=2937523 RepID=UPI0027C87F84|nr:hypothetical protein [Marinifilum sp. D714]MDQ2180023.1 hypothetical protein [Marinifilum sp. D714]
MLYKKMKCIIGRCYLILAILVGTAIVTSAQEQFIQDSIPYDDVRADESDQIQKQEKQNKNDIPIGLFAYNKWVDLNENEIVEKNEFFGLGKQSYAKGESISASLYDPAIQEGTNLKLRIWDTSGNLIRTVRKNYTTKPLFTYSNFDAFLPVGEYIMTINPAESGKTYQIKFLIKEPNGNAFAKIRKKLLPESFHLFKEWIDEDGDMKMDSAEVIGLNQRQFELGKVDFQVGLNLPMNNKQVVYQIWNSTYDMIAMNISRMDSLQHYTMKEDTIHPGNQFLRVLKKVPEGEYMITASLDMKDPIQYRILIQIGDSTANIVKTDEAVAAQTDEIPELEEVTEEIPETPAMAMNISENVENLAPEFTKGQEGFFFFTGFIDLNENNKQEREEFMGADQEYYYSESENVFVQFHLKQFVNSELNLKLFNTEDQLVREQIGNYTESPFVFKVSMPDEPLIPGEYKLIMQPGGSEIKYRLELTIK